ncbi:MAG TPA: histidine kinase [Kofleriaceae bacterium]|nr:histidine kinase [Kofleriaceae bacterium]
MAGFTSTLIALAAPRRLVPILAIVAAISGAQLYYGAARDLVIPFGISLGFVVLAPWTWRALLAKRVTAAGGLAFAAEAVVVVAVFGDLVPHALGIGPTFLGDEGSLAVAVMLYIVGGWGLGRDIELELDVEHAQLKAIRTHLDPHFLYNTLNAIAEWCREDPEVAEEATLRLAELLRATLDALERRSWPLARELALVEDLLALHRVRDTEAFTSTLEVDPAATERELPPLLLVSLVENALKHGPRAGHRGAIAITVRVDGRGVRCEVENPGPYQPRPGGRGLATLRSRLALAYGRNASFAIGAAGPERTRAVLALGAS